MSMPKESLYGFTCSAYQILNLEDTVLQWLSTLTHVMWLLLVLACLKWKDKYSTIAQRYCIWHRQIITLVSREGSDAL